MKPPKVIYLQWYDEDGKPVTRSNDFDVTWCVDKINETDVAYVPRASNAELLAALEGLLAAKDKARTVRQRVNMDCDIYYNGFDMLEAETTARAAITKAKGE